MIYSLYVLDDYFTTILFVVSGFGSGIYIGIASGTSGSFMIPLLTIFIGSSIYQSIGTSLLIDCIIGGVAGIVFIKNRNVDFRTGLLLAIFGVIGAFIGGNFTSGASESSLNLFIGVFLIILGLSFTIYGINRNLEYVEEKIRFQFFKNNKIISLILFGFLIGFGSGFTGMGGGGFIALILIFILGYNIHTAIGTSLVMMFFIAGSGALSHILNNEFVINAALISGCTAGIGAVLGSHFANRINEEKLGRFIGIIILLLGIALIIKILI